MCGMYIINGVHGPEPRSSRGNTSSNPQVSAVIPRPAFNGMERMCQRHGSNQNSHPPVLVRKPFCYQFIHYHISNDGWDLPEHDDVITWKHFPRYWPFVRGIYRSPVNSPYKGQWRRALMLSLIVALITVWVNNREAGDLRGHRAHYDVTVMENMCPRMPWKCSPKYPAGRWHTYIHKLWIMHQQ